MGVIQQRKRILVNTDPQRRCYDGCHYSSELIWTGWEDFETGVSEQRLEFWRDLSAYSAKERGVPVDYEYRMKETADVRDV